MQYQSTLKIKPIVFAIAVCSGAAIAQEELAQLEELIVTAQKRPENIQQLPISLAVVSGRKLDEAGVENLEDLTVHLPGIHYTETGISTQVRVRGIGSDNSQGFEESVGMYVCR